MEGDSSGVVSEEMLEGNHIPAPAKSISSETEMWCAVVARVWDDAFLASDVWLKNSERSCDPDLVRSQARRWLLLDFGTVKSDREEVCTNANINPDMVRAAAIKRMELAKVEDVARREAQLANLDAAFEALIAREVTMRKSEVTRAMSHLADREANV